MISNEEQIRIEVPNSLHSTPGHKDKAAPESAKLPEMSHSIDEQEKLFFTDDPQIHFIKCDQLIEKKTIAPNHLVLKSNLVITEYIDNIPYSYLVNPKSIEGKFYFITKDKENKFSIGFKYDSNVFTHISHNDIIDFVNDINMIIKKNTTSIENDYFLCKRIRGVLEYIGILFVFISICTFLSTAFVFDNVFLILICIAPILFLFGMTLMLIGKCSHIDNSIIKGIKEKTVNDIKKLIHNWNEHFFISRNVLVSYPKSLTYIQLNIDKNCKLEIEDLKV